MQAQFLGGQQDGASSSSICSTSLNGATTPLTLSAISGAANFCNNNAEAYSLSITAGTVSSYTWSYPAGASIQTGGSSTFATILFATTSGSVTVVATNGCGESATSTLPVTNVACSMFSGLDNDGYHSANVCASDLNGGNAPLALSAINGNANFCNNNAEAYSLSVAAGTATSYTWSYPAGASPLVGGTTTSATILFASSSGSVTVVATNGCGESATATLPVTNVVCSMFSGLDNDGYHSAYVCASGLDGGAAPLALSALSGPSNFCNNNTEAYSLSVSAGTASSYTWSYPTGATLLAGGTATNATILFGTTSGSVTVVATNGCGESATAMLPVTNVACSMFSGLDNDGYHSGYVCFSGLNGGAVPLAISALTGPSNVCNNNAEAYFLSVTAGTAGSYTWTYPTGASVQTGGVNTSATIRFGTTSGSVTVVVTNGCGESVTSTLPVTNIACSIFKGLNNDGFAKQPSCNTDLNGSAIPLAPLVSYTISCPGAGGTIITLDATGANNFDYSETSTAAFNYVGTYTNTPLQKTVPNGGTYDIEIKTSAGCTDDIFGIVTTATPSGIPGASITGICQVPGTNTWMYVVDASGNAIISIDDNSTNLGNVAANVYIDGSVGTQNGRAYLQRHYAITTENPPGGSGANVRLYFTATELSNLVTASAATPTADDNVTVIGDLGVTKYNGPTTDGVYDPSDATSLVFIPQSSNGTQFANNYIEFNTPSFSELWPHGSSNASALPIELLFFNGADKDSYNFLEWATATEINNDYFMIERSADGIAFEGIGFIKGAGTSTSENYYSYKDFSPFTPISYYRLKQFDFDKKSSVSNIIAIHRQNKILRTIVYPTLIKGNENLIIKTNADHNSALKIELIDLLGNKVCTKEFMITENTSLLSFPLPDLAAGIYTVVATQNGQTSIEKISVY